MSFSLLPPQFILIGTRFQDKSWVQLAKDGLSEFGLVAEDLVGSSNLHIASYNQKNLIILCAISGYERGTVPIQQAMSLFGSQVNFHLYIEDINPNTLVEGRKITRRELLELNGFRDGLRVLAQRLGYPVYEDLTMAIACSVTSATVLAGF